MIEFLLFLGELLVNVFFLFFFIRMVGKKELKQATPIDFAYMILLTNIGWDMTLEKVYNPIHSFIAMLLLTMLVVGIEWITYKYGKLDRVFIGEPVKIIENGNVNEKIMKKERISERELKSMLREKGIFDVKNVKIGIIEVDGGISVQPYKDD